MDQIKELEKYKSLYDEGAISEEEFRRLKQKLLGLKTDEEKELERQQERAKALAEIERMRAEAAGEKESAESEESEPAQTEERKDPEEQIKEARNEYKKTFDEEKAKEQARLAAIYELEQKKKQEQLAKAQKSAKAVTGFVGNVILWIITVFFGLFAILCVLPSESLSGAIYDLTGLLCFLYAAMACPLLTKKLRENEKLAFLTRHKILWAIGFLFLWGAAIMALPV